MAEATDTLASEEETAIRDAADAPAVDETVEEEVSLKVEDLPESELSTEERDSRLVTHGKDALKDARKLGRNLVVVKDLCYRLAMTMLDARASIWYDYKPEPDAATIRVRDLRGLSPVYRKWVGDYIYGPLEEFAPVETFEVTKADGTKTEYAIPDGDWLTKARRSIEYFVAEHSPQFIRDNGLEGDAKVLGLDMLSVSDKRKLARVKAQGGASSQGATTEGNGEVSQNVPALVKRVEALLSEYKDDYVGKANACVTITADLHDLLNESILLEMSSADRGRIDNQCGRAAATLVSIRAAVESADETAKQNRRAQERLAAEASAKEKNKTG